MQFEQLKSMIQENRKNGIQTVNAVRFLKDGRCLRIEDGELYPKGINVIYQIHYWSAFTKDQCKEIAKSFGAKAIISESND